MPEEYPEKIRLYDHVSNSGIVHLPGRKFRAVAIQGDTLSTILTSALYFMDKSVSHNDEDMYYEAKDLIEKIQGHLMHYEKVLEHEGFERPYSIEVKKLNFDEEFKKRDE